LQNLAVFARWVLDHGYDVRLPIGDAAERPVTQEFKRVINKWSTEYDKQRIVDEPPTSVEDLLSQLAATDVLVATRFHNLFVGFGIRHADFPAIACRHSSTHSI
jgi:polysaccharide pyruvyl transferase WcaK-like protein